MLRFFVVSFLIRYVRIRRLTFPSGFPKLAFSAVPGSFVSALTGIVAGQLYRADLFSLKTYQLPPWLIRLSSTAAPYFIGSTRPPRRTNRALHEGSRASLASAQTRTSANGATDEDEGPITTARQNPSSTARMSAGGRRDNSRGGTTTSVMRDWVNELTGRDGSSPGLRIPSEAEISQVSAMFPNVGRETVVGTLQRRYAWDSHLSPTCYALADHLMWVIGSVFRFPPFHLPSISCSRRVLEQLLINQSRTANLTLAVTACNFSPTTESAIETLLRTEN